MHIDTEQMSRAARNFEGAIDHFDRVVQFAAELVSRSEQLIVDATALMERLEAAIAKQPQLPPGHWLLEKPTDTAAR